MASITDTDLAIGTAHEAAAVSCVHALYRLFAARLPAAPAMGSADGGGGLGDDRRMLADIERVAPLPATAAQRQHWPSRVLGASSRRADFSSMPLAGPHLNKSVTVSGMDRRVEAPLRPDPGRELGAVAALALGHADFPRLTRPEASDHRFGVSHGDRPERSASVRLARMARAAGQPEHEVGHPPEIIDAQSAFMSPLSVNLVRPGEWWRSMPAAPSPTADLGFRPAHCHGISSSPAMTVHAQALGDPSN